MGRAGLGGRTDYHAALRRGGSGDRVVAAWARVCRGRRSAGNRGGVSGAPDHLCDPELAGTVARGASWVLSGILSDDPRVVDSDGIGDNTGRGGCALFCALRIFDGTTCACVLVLFDGRSSARSWPRADVGGQ